jgi:hypothetical protein
VAPTVGLENPIVNRSEASAGDFDGDGAVNSPDLTELLARWAP